MKKMVCDLCNGTGRYYEHSLINRFLKTCGVCMGVGYIREGDIEKDDEGEIGTKT